VKNYLSLQDVDVTFTPRNNILVGPNMAGKSNLIDCIKFLGQMVQFGLSKAFLDRNGFPEVVWKGSDEHRITLQLNARGGEQKAYDYTIVIVGSATGLISVERELLVVHNAHHSATLIDLNHGQGYVTHLDGSPAFAPPEPGHSALEYTVPGWEGTEVKNFVASWRFYSLLPAIMKQVNGAVEQHWLNENGDNLSSWLLTWQTRYPEAFHTLQQVARDVLPGLEAILAPPTQFGTTFLTTREKHLQRPITLWRMSNGELSFLALLSLIFAPPELGAPLYCVEEPENHLHPRLLETLVELLTQRQEAMGAQAAQVIITTHSPYLVDRFSLDDLLVIDKQHGATRCTRPASHDHLRELLEREGLGLGELWFSGALGDSAC
jgi:predicted ATPase